MIDVSISTSVNANNKGEEKYIRAPFIIGKVDTWKSATTTKSPLRIFTNPSPLFTSPDHRNHV